MRYIDMKHTANDRYAVKLVSLNIDGGLAAEHRRLFQCRYQVPATKDEGVLL